MGQVSEHNIIIINMIYRLVDLVKYMYTNMPILLHQNVMLIRNGSMGLVYKVILHNHVALVYFVLEQGKNDPATLAPPTLSPSPSGPWMLLLNQSV